MFTVSSYTVTHYIVNIYTIIVHSYNYTLYRQYLHCVSFHSYIDTVNVYSVSIHSYTLYIVNIYTVSPFTVKFYTVNVHTVTLHSYSTWYTVSMFSSHFSELHDILSINFYIMCTCSVPSRQKWCASLISEPWQPAVNNNKSTKVKSFSIDFYQTGWMWTPAFFTWTR